MQDRLTAKQVAFVAEFFTSPSLRVAAVRAGLNASAGARLAKTPIVVDAIAARALVLGVPPKLGAAGVNLESAKSAGRPQKRVELPPTRTKKVGAKPTKVKEKPLPAITPENVLSELARIGFGNISDVIEWFSIEQQLFDAQGREVLIPGVVMTAKDSETLTRDQLAAVAEVSKSKDGTVKIKLHDKKGALVKLGEHLGMFKPEKVSKDPGKPAGKKDAAEQASHTAQQGTEWSSLLQ